MRGSCITAGCYLPIVFNAFIVVWRKYFLVIVNVRQLNLKKRRAEGGLEIFVWSHVHAEQMVESWRGRNKVGGSNTSLQTRKILVY